MPRAPTPDPHTLFAELVSDTPAVDLTCAIAPLRAEDESDEQSDVETPRSKRLLSPEQRRRDHHNTHTRRCRARLNWRFEALNEMLPVGEVKHKVNILDHAIENLRRLRDENEQLRLLVALRSKRNVAKWVEGFATRGGVEGLRPAVEMLMFVGGWAYAEIWGGEGGGVRVVDYVVKSTALLEGGLVNVGEFCKERVFEGDEGVVGRAFGGEGGWGVVGGGERGGLMMAARVRVGMAVPVPVGGGVRFVVALWDCRDRARDETVLDFAGFVMSCVGNCWGGNGGE